MKLLAAVALLCAMAAPPPPPPLSPLPALPAPPAPPAPPGLYGNNNGEIRVREAGSGKIRFALETTTVVGENVYLCSLEGVARWDETRLAYLFEEPEPDLQGPCEAAFMFRKGGLLEAEQDGVCGCGARGSWMGTYKLVNARRPTKAESGERPKALPEAKPKAQASPASSGRGGQLRM